MQLTRIRTINGMQLMISARPCHIQIHALVLVFSTEATIRHDKNGNNSTRPPPAAIIGLASISDKVAVSCTDSRTKPVRMKRIWKRPTENTSREKKITREVMTPPVF
jgi:hypothetical protein